MNEKIKLIILIILLLIFLVGTTLISFDWYQKMNVLKNPCKVCSNKGGGHLEKCIYEINKNNQINFFNYT